MGLSNSNYLIKPVKKKIPVIIFQKRAIVFFCSLLLISGCHSLKKVVTNQVTPKSATLNLNGSSEFKQGTVAYFEFVNNSTAPITVFGPWQKRIEKFENESWKRVKIIACPCGADCNAPPRTLILKPTEKHPYDWNLMEGWCGKVMDNGIPQTIESISAEGLYRLSVDYSIDGTNRLTITKEFKIIK